MQPFFSIVIPTLNEEKNLPILLEALAKDNRVLFEVVISDSGSTDDTKRIAQKYEKQDHIRFYDFHSRNVSAARNRGAETSKGVYLVFFDADVQPEPGFLVGIKKHIDVQNLDALTVWNRPNANSPLSGKIILGLLNLSMSAFQKVKPSANGPCIVMKKSLFDALKGFDEQIVFGEDFDLIQRANKLKARFSVFKNPVLYVSTRRFEKEGFVISLYKSLKALVYQLIFGPIKKPLFDYKMGGKTYET